MNPVVMQGVLSSDQVIDEIGQTSAPIGYGIAADSFVPGTLLRFRQNFHTDCSADTQLRVFFVWQNNIILQTNINVLAGQNRGAVIEGQIFRRIVMGGEGLVVNSNMTLDFGAGVLHLDKQQQTISVPGTPEPSFVMLIERGTDVTSTGLTLRWGNIVWERGSLES